MELGGNLLDPSAQEFYPSLSSPVPTTVPALPPPPFPPTFPQFYYPPIPAPPPPAEYVRPAWITDDLQPTRGVVLSMVPRHVSEPDVVSSLECFGAVRAVDMSELASDGIVTVHFYDLRSAQAALHEVREHHMRQQSRMGQLYGIPVPVPMVTAQWDWQETGTVGTVRGSVCGHAVWAHFAVERPDESSQGTIVVMSHLPSGVSLHTLRETFESYGSVKEVRESAVQPYNKFIEFFDTRDATRALAELNGKEVFGRRLVLEFTRPAASHARRRNLGVHHGHYHQFPMPPRLRAQNIQNMQSNTSDTSKVVHQQQQQEEVVILRRGNQISDSSETQKTHGDSSIAGSSSTTSSNRKNKNVISPTSSKSVSPSSSNVSSSKHPPNRKNWKGKGGAEARFLFKESEGELGQSSGPCQDDRTTVMIRNIPNKYSQKLLLNMLDNHCIHCNEQIVEGGVDEPPSAYDFLYLPIDFNNKCNVGYGFVNLTTPQAAFRLYKAFHKQPWEVFNSRKICQVTYARLQGLETLKEHFKNSKFACDNDDYMPVEFSPPRDGKQKTEPTPIGGRELPPPQSSQSKYNKSDGGETSSTNVSVRAPSDQDESEEMPHGCEETSSRLGLLGFEDQVYSD